MTRESLDISHLENALNSHILLSITDLEGKIIYVNENFAKSLNFSKDEILGKTHRIFKSNNHPVQFYRTLWDTINSGKVWSGAILNKCKDGKTIWLKTKIFPVSKAGKITHFISVRTDITENIHYAEMLQVAQNLLQKQNMDLFEELEKNKIAMKHHRFSVIGEIASKMAHDLRNPLSILRASLENMQLLYGFIPSSEKIFVRMDNAIDRIAHQVEDVLDFIKSKELEKESSSIDDLISESLLLQKIPEKIMIKKNYDDFSINCDYIMMCTTIKNLVHNAIHACGEQGVIEIIASEKNDSAIISITDSGSGIPDENIQKIFEPLFTTKQRGTGLGLASVKNTIERHGGKISVKNNPTTFTMILPQND
ncbi:two-component system sensor histidine kinase NtrB [Nitrosopumilus ureiphilus]|uniref:two-component system sensor histidine kinase NtrB n=1 Tax=Nitrosopumilus ureiphilus TaxID=1470067 RepID=UPI0015CEB425|nr:ATP-binding protein [Nitrosopumilus ureiphilus]